MTNKKFPVMFFAFIGIAFLGLGYQLLYNPAGFLFKLFISLGITLAMFFVVYKIFFQRRNESSEMKKYREALKQSKRKYGSDRETKKTVTNIKSQRKNRRKSQRRRHKHLTVIEGAKSTKNSRASQ